MGGTVSLYELALATGVHRDTLERLCLRRRDPIQVHFLAASTPRYRVRAIDAGDAPRLMRLAAGHRRRRRRPPSAAANRRTCPIPPMGAGWPYIHR